MVSDYQVILDFWFEELTPEDWFQGGEAIDQLIHDRFLETQQATARGENYAWRETLEGRVAEIIVLDQFSRNLYREDGRAYASDDMALTLAQEIRRFDGFKDLPLDYQLFATMPFMHSESKVIHEIAVDLFQEHEEWESNFQYEIAHKEIIDQFGRYPHRNEQMGRPSTAEEIEWLKHNKGF